MNSRGSLAGVVLVLALVLGPLAGVAVPAAAGGLHGDHVVVDPQVSADGTVVAETASTLASGFVVLKTDDGGRPGDPVGHAFLDGAQFATDVPVQIDQAAWAEWSGNRTLWAVVHADDGDGVFEPDSDPSVAARSPAARVSFAIRKSEAGSARVLARQFDPHRVVDGHLTVRRVTLVREGYVVAESLDGRVVGTRSLGPGRHDNVSVPLDPDFLAAQDADYRVRLVAYRDDGDGSFGDGDRPVRVADSVVGTDVVVAAADGTPTATEGPLVVTPSPTATPESTSTPTPTDSTVSTTTTMTATSATGPGFGATVALAACLVSVALCRVTSRLGR